MAAFTRLLIVFTLLFGSSACALRPVVAPGGNACLRHFRAMDARIEAAGARDHGAHRPAGFPWLRSTRFTASFAGELHGEARWRDWLARLRAEDLAARRAELANAGIKHQEREFRRLAACGRQLNADLLADAGARQRLRAAVAVPDDYSLLQRLFGAYPLALPFLKAGISDYQQQVSDSYEQPVEALPVTGHLRLWQPPAATGPVDMSGLPRDALGAPQISDPQLRRLAAQHAPNWWIDSAGDFDRPGWPRPGPDGPGVDDSRAVVFYDKAYTRRQDRVLLQLVYVIWFDRRPARSAFDPYAGRLDGVVWRVTLDAQGRPLFYDSIHSCGCYHRIFPAQALQPRPQDWDQEPWLLPQADIPMPPLALRLQSATHYLQRVVAADRLRAETTSSYDLQPYVRLRSLPAGDGERRSLFGAGGIVAGSERLERWWLWPSGVPSPGSMRQWGRHAIAFVGMRHFDDPYLAERVVGLTGAGESGE